MILRVWCTLLQSRIKARCRNVGQRGGRIEVDENNDSTSVSCDPEKQGVQLRYCQLTEALQRFAAGGMAVICSACQHHECFTNNENHLKKAVYMLIQLSM